MMKRDIFPIILNFQSMENLRVSLVDSRLSWIRRVLSFFSLTFLLYRKIVRNL